MKRFTVTTYSGYGADNVSQFDDEHSAIEFYQVTLEQSDLEHRPSPVLDDLQTDRVYDEDHQRWHLPVARLQ